MANEVVLTFAGDAGPLKKTLRDLDGSTGKFKSRLGGVGKAAAVGLASLGVAAVGAGAKMVDLAGDAAEVQSKLEVTFGKRLPGIIKNLDAFSEATGTSRYELRQQVADMGALLKPMLGSQKAAGDMSTKFVKLATDLGSFNNIPTGEALEKIRAGLVGEAEPLRSLGVLISDAAVKQEAYRSGIAKTGAELTEVQKVQARANLIMQQTTLAQGDAERTSGSFANQMKRLKAGLTDTATEIGVALLPVANKLVTWVNSSAMPALRSFAQTALPAVKSAFEQVRAGVQVAVDWFQANVVPVFREVASTAQALWKRFGSDITNLTRTAFEAIKGVVQPALETVRAVIKTVLALLRGDWSAVWAGLKGIVSGALNTVVAVVRGTATLFYEATKAIGRQIVQGIWDGIQAAAGWLKSKIAGFVGDVVGFIKNPLKIFSPSRVMRDEVGIPIVQGIAAGIESKSSTVAKAAARVVDDARKAAQQRLSAMRSALLSGATSGLDARTERDISALQDTPTARRLAQIEHQQKVEGAQRQRQSLVDAIMGASSVADQLSALQDLKDFDLDQEAEQLRAQLQAGEDAIRAQAAAAQAQLQARLNPTPAGEQRAFNIVVNAMDPQAAATAVVRAIDEYERRNGQRFARA